MVGRIVTLVLAAALSAFWLGGTSAAADRDDVAFARQEDADGVLATEDGDGDDDTNGDDTDSATSGVDSNDGTNSRVTSVTRGDDRSRGDLTRDQTKDGPGTSTRDRTANHTNDRSWNDTR